MRRCDSRACMAGAASLLRALCALLLIAVPTSAQNTDQPKPISVNIGARTAFIHTEPEGADGTDAFVLDSVRLFLSGGVTKQISVSFNTEYDGPSNQVRVMDAIGQFEMSPAFNIWVGRFLPPSDRSNLYGPYYASHWSIYTDGIQDGYPFISAGRANGAAYWGQFGKVSVSGGLFDGASMTPDATLVKAGRVEVNLWDAEPGYYRSGTYYGSKNILAVGVAGQAQERDNTAVSVDLLLERKVAEGGAITVEGEYARYNRLGGYNQRYANDRGGYVLAGYLLPMVVGQGRFQVLGKVGRANFSGGLVPGNSDYDQTTTEVDVNYIIKGYDARIMAFYVDTRFSAVQSDFKRVGIGIQLQK